MVLLQSQRGLLHDRSSLLWMLGETKGVVKGRIDFQRRVESRKLLLQFRGKSGREVLKVQVCESSQKSLLVFQIQLRAQELGRQAHRFFILVFDPQKSLYLE